jgi:hypothetical protein
MGQQQQMAQVEEGAIRRTRWLGTANLGRAHSDPDKGGCLLVAPSWAVATYIDYMPSVSTSMLGVVIYSKVN